jgi:hypothetical protein
MSKIKVQYETKKVALSRVYPFGKLGKAIFTTRDKNGKKTFKEREITVLTVAELTGVDDENLIKQSNQSIYREISVACGLTIDEAKTIARADAMLVQKVMQDFLYDSEDIELIG